MRANVGFQRHGVADQPTYAAIAVEKWVNVIQAMMGRRYRNDPLPGTEAVRAVSVGEILHEGLDPFGRRGDVPPHRNIFFRS